MWHCSASCIGTESLGLGDPFRRTHPLPCPFLPLSCVSVPAHALRQCARSRPSAARLQLAYTNPETPKAQLPDKEEVEEARKAAEEHRCQCGAGLGWPARDAVLLGPP